MQESFLEDVAEPVIVIHDSNLNYPSKSPFSPNILYPEYKYSDISTEMNLVYNHIRQLFYEFGLDANKYGTRDWNPLGEFIRPGNHVLIKPNWVKHTNPIEPDLDSLVTHSSIIRVVLDYTLIALKGTGSITIGDSPVQSCDFKILEEITKIKQVVQFLNAHTFVPISVSDFRKGKDSSNLLMNEKEIDQGDSSYIKVNLSERSFLNEIACQSEYFRVTNYDHREMIRYHNNLDHMYLISNKVLHSDVVIELPKLKTHRKAGLTCCLKNNVGINVKKDSLVHHRQGAIVKGGDAYLYFNIFKSIREKIEDIHNRSNHFRLFYIVMLKMLKLLSSLIQRESYYEGSWYGNDTIWRMILDLNNILFYCDRSGTIQNEQQRKVIYLVDGIIGGQKEGPLKPQKIDAGLLLFGTNPLFLDIISAKLIGFDYKKIPVLNNALKLNQFKLSCKSLASCQIILNNEILSFNDLEPVIRFEPSSGWKNHIESEK